MLDSEIPVTKVLTSVDVIFREPPFKKWQWWFTKFPLKALSDNKWWDISIFLSLKFDYFQLWLKYKIDLRNYTADTMYYNCQNKSLSC